MSSNINTYASAKTDQWQKKPISLTSLRTQTYFWSLSVNRSGQTISVTQRLLFWCSPNSERKIKCDIAFRLAIYFNSTSADKSWWNDCTDTSLTESKISDNRSLYNPTSPLYNDLKYDKPGPDQAWNVVKMSFQLRRFNSSIEINTLKRTCI